MTSKNDCELCNIGSPPDGTTLFLGLTVENFQASTGWEGTTSTLTVNLVYDPCEGKKYYRDSLLQEQIHTGADPGFIGLPLWERADNSTYRACAKESPSDTLVEAAQDIIGSPAFFRMGTWEWCGIIRNWSETTGSGGNRFTVTLVDPRIILEQSQVIVGEYAGITSFQNATTGLTTNNVFNVFGFAEQFGCYCPPYSQCSPGVYDAVDCPTTCCGVDGTVFGTPIGGFGGSTWNERGMLAADFFRSFNMLANSIPVYSGALLFSPYGRVVYRAPATANYGLMPKDAVAGNPGYEENLSYFFVDISELYSIIASYGALSTYRIAGPVLSLSDLITQICDDFGCDYYIDLVPVTTGATSPSGIDKFIKVRIVDRSVQPAIGEVCSFIESVEDCLVSKSQGCELRNESNSAFIIGGNKQTIYQAEQNYNPDANFTLVPNDTDTLASLSPFTNSMLSVSPECSGSAIDDTILPYFGKYQDGDYIQPCYGANGWEFWAPTDDLIMSLNFADDIVLADIPSIPDRILITELELRATDRDIDDWHAVVAAMESHTWEAILSPLGLIPHKGNAELINIIVDREGRLLGRDLANPARGKFKRVAEYIKNEVRQRVYQWVKRYYDEYYGTKFMVRTPFTCAKPDLETGKLRFSEVPSNDGGWTEEPTVIGLPNLDGISARSTTGATPIGFFQDQSSGKIKPFVRFRECNTALEFEDNENFLVYYEINPSDIGLVTFGDGDPDPLSALTSPPDRVYIDNLTGMIWVWAPDDPIGAPGGAGNWVTWRQTDVTYRDSSPSGTPAALGILTTSRIYDCANGKMYIYSGNTDWVEFTVNVFVKASLEESYVFYEASLAYAPRVVVSIDRPVRQNNSRSLLGVDFVLDNIRQKAGKAVMEQFRKDKMMEGVDFKDAYIFVAPESWLPDAAAIPMFHNDLTYGPWQCVGTTGETRVEKDDSLVPWTFGGYAGLDLAGNIAAQAPCSSMALSETGSVEIVGLPTLPLGAELGALTGGFFGGGTQLIENRTRTDLAVSGVDYDNNTVTVTYGYFDYSGYWTGLYGPNITSISVQNGVGGATTSYSFSTFTSRRNLLLKKQLDSLKQKQQSIPALINRITNSIIGTRLSAITNRQRRVEQLLSGAVEADRTPHEVFTGRLEPWLATSGLDPSGYPTGRGFQDVSGYRRPIVVTEKLAETNHQIHNGYDAKAIMSIDGLLRPVSLDGYRDNLPRLCGPADLSTCSANISPSGEARITGTLLDARDIQPLQNPSGLNNSRVATRWSNTPLVGHDYDIVARLNPGADEEDTDTLIPESGLIVPLDGYTNDWSGGYTDDYGFMAIKGPVVIQQWGWDVDEKPVPNINSTEEQAARGQFSGYEPGDKFLDGHLRKSHTWPVAPLDLRLNRERGVWESYASNGADKIIQGRIKEDLDFSGDIIFEEGIYWGLVYPGDTALVDIGPSGCDSWVEAVNNTNELFMLGDPVLVRPISASPNKSNNPENHCYEIFDGNPTQFVNFSVVNCPLLTATHDLEPIISGFIWKCDDSNYSKTFDPLPGNQDYILGLSVIDLSDVRSDIGRIKTTALSGGAADRNSAIVATQCNATGVARIEKCTGSGCDSFFAVKALSFSYGLYPRVIRYEREEISYAEGPYSEASGTISSCYEDYWNQGGSSAPGAGNGCINHDVIIRYDSACAQGGDGGCSPALNPDAACGIGILCENPCGAPPVYIGQDAATPALTVSGIPVNAFEFEGGCVDVDVSGCIATINLGLNVSGVDGCVNPSEGEEPSGTVNTLLFGGGLNVKQEGCTATVGTSGWSGVLDSLENVWCTESGLRGLFNLMSFQCGVLVDVSGYEADLTPPTPAPMMAPLARMDECLTCCSGIVDFPQDCPTDCTDCDNVLTITLDGSAFTKACSCWNGKYIEIEKVLTSDCEWFQNGNSDSDCGCNFADSDTNCDCTDHDGGDGVEFCVEVSAPAGTGDPCVYCDQSNPSFPRQPCSDTCATGLTSYSATLVCVDGYWIMSVSIGTAGGGCPHENALWQGVRGNTDGCPPKGAWELDLDVDSYVHDCDDASIQCLNIPTLNVTLS